MVLSSSITNNQAKHDLVPEWMIGSKITGRWSQFSPPSKRDRRLASQYGNSNEPAIVAVPVQVLETVANRNVGGKIGRLRVRERVVRFIEEGDHALFDTHAAKPINDPVGSMQPN